jgi:hypothetical protein
MAETNEEFDKLVSEIEEQERQEAASTSPKEEGSTSEKEEAAAASEVVEVTETDYPHEDIMREEGLVWKDLPKEIQSMISTFKRKRTMATTKKSKNEATWINIKGLSVLIADKIMSWLEERDGLEPAEKEEGGQLEGEAPVSSEGGQPEAIDTPPDEEEVVTEEIVGEGADDLDGDGLEGEETSPKEEKGGIFGGVLGGILDW